MSTITQLRTALSGNNVSYIKNAFDGAREDSLSILLKNLDTNHDRKLSAQEITEGIDRYCSRLARTALNSDSMTSGIKSFFGGKQSLKPEVKARIKQEIETILGSSIDLKQFDNMSLLLNNIRVDDIFALLDILKELCKTKAPEHLRDARNNFNNGNYRGAAKSVYNAGKAHYGQVLSNSDYRNNVKTCNEAAGRCVKDYVQEKSGSSLLGKAAGWYVETTTNILSGVTLGDLFGD